MSRKAKKSQTTQDMESLTIHGISKVTSATNKYTRIIWLVLCLSAATSLGITAVKSLMKYFEYQTFVEVTFKQNDKMALPAITFCHTNYYNPYAYLIEDPPVFQHFPKSCNFTDQKYFKNKMNKLIFQFTCQMFIGVFDAKTLGMNVDMPQYFQFPKGFEPSPNKEPCVTLNRNSTLVQLAAGERYGLHMILYNYPFDKKTYDLADKPLTDGRNGIYVMLHEPEQTITMGDGIIIPPGHHTHISVTKQSITRLPYPYPSMCKNGDSDLHSIYPGKNTQIMCYSSCVFKQLYKMCPGVVPPMKVFMKAPEFPVEADLMNGSFWRCILKGISRLSNHLCNCKQHCNEATYTAITNRNPWPQKWQAQSFARLINKLENVTDRNLSTTEIRDRLIKVSIYYSDFKEYLLRDRQIYDLSSIASDLGGQMGLFLGASLLSLAEIIALIVTRIKRSFRGGDRVMEVSIKSKA